MNLNKELLEKARGANSPEELLNIVKENGYQLSEESAKAYFEQLHKIGEIADEELENVAGGGCYNNGRLVITPFTAICEHYECPCTRTWTPTKPELINVGGTKVCSRCGYAPTCCEHCRWSTWEDGLYVCIRERCTSR